MVYVALLRGINVGGRNKIDMKLLKMSFERVGMRAVETYINSGNIIFSRQEANQTDVARILEDAILQDFRLNIRVLIRSFPEIQAVINAIPSHWQNDKTMKSDILFLWNEIDNESILSEILPREGIDTAIYVPGTLLWSCARRDTTRSALMKLASGNLSRSLYKKMTIRNVNTARKIHTIMKSSMQSSLTENE